MAGISGAHGLGIGQKTRFKRKKINARDEETEARIDPRYLSYENAFLLLF